jgi:hypothetical protein
MRLKKMNDNCYIYKCTFPNGKRYIGITNNFKRRKLNHLQGLKNPKYPINYALKKYHGKEKWEIIGEFSKEVSEKLEIALIDLLNTRKPNGYNLSGGGEINKEVHEDTRNKIRISNSKRKMSKKHKQAILKAIKSVPRSIETKRKISEGHKGKKLSAETKKKISEFQKGKTRPRIQYDNIRGKTYEEIYGVEKAKIIKQKLKGRTAWNKGIKLKEEHKKKLSEIHKGKKLSEEHKKKISISIKGRTLSKEHKIRIGNANRKRCKL